MSVSENLEFSVFGVANPLSRTDPLKHQEFVDEYIHSAQGLTYKVRNWPDGRRQAKFKLQIGINEGIAVVQHQTFDFDPLAEPLRSLMNYHGIDPDEGGIAVRKTRDIYAIDDRVQLVYTEGEHEGVAHTNLTLATRRDPNAIRRYITAFGLPETHISYFQHLTGNEFNG